MSSGPFALTLPAPSPDLPVADLIAESAQVRELFHLRWIDADSKVEQRSNLRKDAGKHHLRREVITDPDERARKLAIETGYDIRRDVFLKAPLEPWLCDYPIVAMRAYADIMNEVPGADIIANWNDKARLDALLYLRSEQLVMVSDDRLKVLPLSDARPRDRRQYPGSPLSDELSKAGKYLGSHADDLIIESLKRWSAGRPGRGHHLRPGALTAAGIQLPAHDICEVANEIKARDPSLAGFRFLSVTLTRKRIPKLLEAGVLTELAPPRPVREGRSWKTIPRMLARLVTAADSSPALRGGRRRTTARCAASTPAATRPGSQAADRPASRAPR